MAMESKAFDSDRFETFIETSNKIFTVRLTQGILEIILYGFCESRVKYLRFSSILSEKLNEKKGTLDN